MIKLLDKKITLNSDVGSRRCILTKDEHQWILITGPPHVTEEQMIKRGTRYFYKDVEAFLTALLFKRFRALVDDWDENKVINAVNMAKTEVIAVGREVEANTKGLLIYESS
jgi:hypothetical protein